MTDRRLVPTLRMGGERQPTGGDEFYAPPMQSAVTPQQAPLPGARSRSYALQVPCWSRGVIFPLAGGVSDEQLRQLADRALAAL
ncbi:MAG: hypothetical protein ACREON_01380 [Gemmatimonadaceae bacterium]